jgi:hypothetical protein
MAGGSAITAFATRAAYQLAAQRTQSAPETRYLQMRAARLLP